MKQKTHKIALWAAALVFFEQGAWAAPLEVQSTQLQWSADKNSQALLGQIEIVSAHEWEADDIRFGGFSGMLINEGRLTAVTDRGTLLTGSVVDGSLTGADFSALTNPKGKPLKKKVDSDAESLAVNSGGGYLVAFERNHRILAYKDKTTELFSTPEDLPFAALNHGPEALTRLKDGRYLLLLEKSGDDKNLTHGWIGKPGAWEALTYAREEGYRPTGATTLSDGSVLVVERYHSLLVGVRARLRRIEVQSLNARSHLKGELLGEIRAPQPVDNYEAIATTRDKNGELLIHLLSDDNFSALQRTLFLTLRLRNPL